MQNSARCLFIRLQQVLNVNRSKSSQHKVIITDDNSMFIAWHPKVAFPYECTKPLPKLEIDQNMSVLKTQISPELKEIFKKKSPEQARLELMSITHTTKHRWFPRARDKKAKKTSMDREYL